MSNALQGEDARLEHSSASGRASAALWWTHVPEIPGEKVGVIGSFAGESAEATAGLLAKCGETLRVHGCSLAVGPMDGNTWRKYRFVTEPGTEPPFFLEPSNPREYPAWWTDAGFTPLAEYYSAAVGDLAVRDERLDAVRQRMAKTGVTIRPLDPKAFAGELRRIYEVSVVSFRENYLYTPLPFEAFAGQYQQIESRVRPELVLLAEHDGRPVGYVFAIPDFASATRGVAMDTVIVKTLAVLPGRTYMGLGALLLADVHDAARRLGFARAIHALMHESNKSRNLSAHYGETIRRYTLFQKRISA